MSVLLWSYSVLEECLVYWVIMTFAKQPRCVCMICVKHASYGMGCSDYCINCKFSLSMDVGVVARYRHCTWIKNKRYKYYLQTSNCCNYCTSQPLHYNTKAWASNQLGWHEVVNGLILMQLHEASKERNFSWEAEAQFDFTLILGQWSGWLDTCNRDSPYRFNKVTLPFYSDII